MIRRFTASLLLALALCAPASAADNAIVVTVGSGVTMRTVDIGGGVQSSMVILGSTAGASIYGTAGTANANVLTIQGVASMTPILATLQASGTTAIGKVDPNTIGSWGLQVSTQNSATPTNGGLVLGQFNTTPTTITTGNVSPLQMDNAGNLLVNIKAGAGSGGTAIADKAAWTVSSTNFTLSGGEFTTGGATACTTGQACTVGMTATRAYFTDTSSMGGTAISASCVSNYGTGPGAVACPSVNANVTNANANGQAVMASSSPVAIASNQSVADPCMFQAKSQKNINTASGTTLLVAASGSTKVYVCSLAIVAPSAVAVSLSEGTGATCNTANQAGVMGVAVNGTAANGMSFAANGGMTYGNGSSTVAFTATAANALCLFQSGTAQLSGNMTYVQQ